MKSTTMMVTLQQQSIICTSNDVSRVTGNADLNYAGGGTGPDESKQTLRSAQCARIIICISNLYGVPLDEATDIYYNSETANLIEEGVADLHCRSDKYLAGEVWREYQETRQSQ